MADRYLSLLLRLFLLSLPLLLVYVTTTYTRHGRNTFGSRGYNRRDNIFVFSWKSEAVLYSDHDRCYLFIPKQARLPPPPLVYLSATLVPLSSLLLFNPALSIRIYIFLPLFLSLSLFPSPLFSSGPHYLLACAFFYKIDRNRGYGHRGAGVSKAIEQLEGGGEAELLEGQTLLGPRLSFPSSPVSKRSRRWYRVYIEIFIEERNDSLARRGGVSRVS